MAERNLCLVANRVLGFLRSDEIREIRTLNSRVFQSLEESVATLAPLLLDAEKKSTESSHIPEWVMDLLGLKLHEAENLLEDMKMRVEEDLKARHSVGSSRKMSSVVKKAAKKVLFSNSLPFQAPSDFVPRDLIFGMDEIVKEICRCEAMLSSLHLSELSEDEEIRGGGAREEAAAGLFSGVVEGWTSMWDKDRAAIVDILMDNVDRKVEILAIVGEAKKEKTVLVRCVFDDERVQSHFDVRVWVDLDRPRYKDECTRVILEEIVASSDGQSVSNNLDMETLQRRVEECLDDRRYLIVVPGMWTSDSEELNSVMQLIQRGALGSIIILVTTSFYKLVEDNGGATRDYRLECAEEYWDFFNKRLFVDEQEPIRGSLHELVGKINIAEQEQQVILCENKMFQLMDSYFVHYDSVLPVLMTRYNSLPSPQKHCFAYCLLYPEDHDMDVQTLVRLWMAQGFIVPPTVTERRSDEDLEDIGYEYFLNLLERSLLQVSKLDARWRVTKCRMYPLVHNVHTWLFGAQCRLIANRTSCYWDSSTLHVSSISDSLFEKCLHNIWISRNLRSLIFPIQRGARRHIIMQDYWDNVLNLFTYLRALDMHACGIKKELYSIGALKHLRYLDLSQNDDITDLPDSITKLLNLQTLRLSWCIKLSTLPTDIGNLVNLRHLEIDGCYSLTSLPRGFGRLTNLRTLSQFILNKDITKANEELNELKQLVNLREVQIKTLMHEMGEKISTCLKAIRRVRSLLLEWESRAPKFENIEAKISIDQFPELEELTLISFRDINGMFSGTSVPRNLSKLVLRRCVKCQNLPPLDHCFMLKVLVLDEMPDLEYISEEFSTQVCPSLQELWFTELPKLKAWWKSSFNAENLPSFQRISKLVIEDCPNLASLPLFPTLEEGLVLDSTSWKPFELTMEHKVIPNPSEASSSSSTSSSPPLSKLKALCIANIDELDDSLQEVIKLKELHIWRWGGKEIPSWIEKLKSLEKLVIRVCPDLETLPEEIKSLKSLKTLEIEDCETLLRRCEKGIGMDWYKIAHIPERRLGRISKK